MKNILFLLCLFSFQNICLSQVKTKVSMIHDGLSRTFSFYVPAKYKNGNKVPLVFNLHGYSSNGDQQEFYGDFRKIADTAGFIIVHPDGTIQAQTMQTFWNVGLTGSSGVDDIGFLHKIIDTLSSIYSIDENRIYSTGMSNGGFMSYHLACNSVRFAAIASVTGSMTTLTELSCKNSLPIPIMEIHGDADGVVAYNGSLGVLSIPNVLKFWINKNALDSSQVSIVKLLDKNTTDGATAVLYTYPGRNEVQHYKIINGGHTWPGAAITIGTTCMDFNASEVIWQFFAKYRRIIGSNESIVQAKFNITPNPAEDYLKINFENVYENLNFEIFDLQNKLIRSGKLSNHINTVFVSDLKPGMYVFTIKSSNIFQSIKFIKI